MGRYANFSTGFEYKFHLCGSELPGYVGIWGLAGFEEGRRK